MSFLIPSIGFGVLLGLYGWLWHLYRRLLKANGLLIEALTVMQRAHEVRGQTNHALSQQVVSLTEKLTVLGTASEHLVQRSANLLKPSNN